MWNIKTHIRHNLENFECWTKQYINIKKYIGKPKIIRKNDNAKHNFFYETQYTDCKDMSFILKF